MMAETAIPEIKRAEHQPGLEVVHLIFPDPQGKIKTNRVQVLGAAFSGGGNMIACKPDQAILPKCCSSETSAVNCPLCHETEAFVKLEAEQNGIGMNEADKEALAHLIAKHAMESQLPQDATV